MWEVCPWSGEEVVYIMTCETVGWWRPHSSSLDSKAAASSADLALTMDWGYGETGATGPDHWHLHYPLATTGTRQSPVDIVTSQTVALTSPSLSVEYSEASDLAILNTGASWQVQLDTSQCSVCVGGQTYRAAQCHAHWGGSEHSVDGEKAEAELHIVHYNTKYETLGRAVDKSDGLAVLGILLTLQGELQDQTASTELDKICRHLPDIELRDSSTNIQEELSLERLLPADRSYFTYLGSLTTPPLLESVTWILFKHPVTVTKQQVTGSVQTLRQR